MSIDLKEMRSEVPHSLGSVSGPTHKPQAGVIQGCSRNRKENMYLGKSEDEDREMKEEQ